MKKILLVMMLGGLLVGCGEKKLSWLAKLKNLKL